MFAVFCQSARCGFRYLLFTEMYLIFARCITTNNKDRMTFSLKHVKRDPQQKPTGKPPMLILIHGLGSNEQDLFSFAPHLDPQSLIVSVQAPMPYGYGGYAWFNLDFSNAIPQANIQQVKQARQLLTTFIAEAIEAYQPDTNRIYLAGFSQGAIMSYATAFAIPEKIAGIVAMSGYILKELAPATATPAMKKLNILVTHGTQDQVLPVFLGRASDNYLKALQLNFTYKEYLMGHEVNAACFNDIKNWLSTQLM